jgi:hypothetical protein
VKKGFPIYGFFGLAIMIIAEVLLFRQVGIVTIYFTPIVWTGYILLVDALNYRIRGQSLIRTRKPEFLLLLPMSVFCWAIFELYNLHMKNWEYVGLPQDFLMRSLGYVWSFATIFPAILETAELLQPVFSRCRMRPRKISYPLLGFLMAVGFLCLTVPLILPASVSAYLMALVWVGFAFLLEPINYYLGGRSLFAHFEQGELKQFFGLMAAGVMCGFLWEFWNYWAVARWVYTLPFPWAGPKIFEMPLMGFLGFIPFAVECHSMSNYLFAILRRNRSSHPLIVTA